MNIICVVPTVEKLEKERSSLLLEQEKEFWKKRAGVLQDKLTEIWKAADRGDNVTLYLNEKGVTLSPVATT